MKTIIRMTIVAVLCAATIAPCSEARSRSDRLKPQWMRKLPVASNASFEYVAKGVHAPSVSDARKACLSSIISEAGYNNGVLITVNEKSNLSVEQRWDNGKLVDREVQTYDRSSDIKGDEFKLYVKEIAEFYEYKAGGYELTKLYQKSTGGAIPLFDNVYVTDKYGIGPMFLSIIPGVGQFYKGDALKGTLMLASVSICTTGAVVLFNQSSNYSAKMRQSHEVDIIKFNKKMADDSRTGAYVCIGIGAAIYLYNLIDAAVAPGARRVVATNNGIAIKL